MSAVRFLVSDRTGRILRSGTCPLGMAEQQAHQDELAFLLDAETDVDCERDAMDLATGELLPGAAVEVPLPYFELRRRAYPRIGDQLDALWKGGADAAAMKKIIDAVKAKYPKPVTP